MGVLKNAIAIICASIWLSGCMSAIFTGASMAYDHNKISNKAKDFYLKSQIENKINNDPAYYHSRIAVTVFHRVVLLVGQVQTSALRQRVIKSVQTVSDIRRIYNGLVLGQPISFSQQTQDAWITTKIKTKLIAAKGINPNKIKVVTENDTVYLLGIVTHQQARIATYIAQHTANVKKIINIFFYIPDIA